MSENCNGHCEHCAGSHDEMELESNIIALTDDEGDEVEFECLMTFDCGDHFYASLLPVVPLEDFEEGEVLIMRLDEEGEESVFSPVESEEELEAAWNEFIRLYEEEDEE